LSFSCGPKVAEAGRRPGSAALESTSVAEPLWVVWNSTDS
jgi:hypothetical protein